jgi:4-amino-4-deoxychorismate lyase
MYTWVNSQFHNSVSVFDRGLSFGDGLFETMRVSGAQIPLLHYHLERLFSGARRLRINVNQDEVKTDIESALSLIKDQKETIWRLKYIVTRGESNSGYTPNPRGVPTRIMQMHIYDAGFSRLLQQQGIKTCTCQWRLSEQPLLAGIKHLNRLDQVMAKQECSDRDSYEGLMLDQNGRYVEGTMSNVFAVTTDGKVITPRMDHAGVEGVMRKLVIDELCKNNHIECYEADINRMDEFSEVFVTNALMGIVPVVAVDQISFEIGPVTRRLQQILTDSQWMP